jgi:hypothetical protein
MRGHSGPYLLAGSEVLLRWEGLPTAHLHGATAQPGRAICAKDATLSEALDWITLALGGAAGSRLARRMGLLVDGSTLLRQLRRCSSATATPRSPRVLGIDD